MAHVSVDRQGHRWQLWGVFYNEQDAKNNGDGSGRVYEIRPYYSMQVNKVVSALWMWLEDSEDNLSTAEINKNIAEWLKEKE
jgi:hypothetical protein